ncbi:hypothetical protein HMPREF9622_02470 [Cutibacterium modestum HL037PA3]|nr:hypothetical protein HMPREF9621_02281 [Cutibacterium modestum HL037PA2]EFT14533.1 hypothetical protein HMPREF9622_02470 [Cutibacterium modestum HL037PA3]
MNGQLYRRSRGAHGFSIAYEPSFTVMQTLRESKPLDAKTSGRVVTTQIVESTTRHAL